MLDAAAFSRLSLFLRREICRLRWGARQVKIGGGQSNPAFLVAFENRDLVLRKKPDGSVLPPAHAIDCKYGVMAALAATEVPVPPVLLYYAESDLIGTPFYVMERVPGRVFNDSAAPGIAPAERRAISLAMADTLATLHQVDWRSTGLADFGKQGGYVQRQLRRWQTQWQLSRAHVIPQLYELFVWLTAHLPDDQKTAVAHGDFKLNNLLFHPTEPRVVAVLDWEFATLRPPLADVAFSTTVWMMLPCQYGGIRGLDLQALGIPSEHEYLAHYYQSVGHHHPARQALPFHWAFAFMLLSVIFASITARAERGIASSGNAARVCVLAASFACLGIEAIHTTIPPL